MSGNSGISLIKLLIIFFAIVLVAICIILFIVVYETNKNNRAIEETTAALPEDTSTSDSNEKIDIEKLYKKNEDDNINWLLKSDEKSYEDGAACRKDDDEYEKFIKLAEDSNSMIDMDKIDGEVEIIYFPYGTRKSI